MTRRRLLSLCLALLLCPTLAHAGAFTTAADGDYSNPATWTGGVIPGNGDTVTQNHNLTLSDARTIGTSPAAGNVVWIVAAGKTLTFQGGGALTLRGDLENRAVVTFQKGSALVFDSSASASPTTTAYKARCSNAVAVGVARFVTSGTDTPGDVTFSSVTTGGALPGYFASDASRGYYSLSYADFTDIGGATNDCLAVTLSNVANKLSLDHCRFTRCGRLAAPSITSDADCTVDHCQWTGSTGSACTNISCATARTAAIRRISYCAFDINMGNTGGFQLKDFTLQYLHCPAGLSLSLSATVVPATIDRCFIRSTSNSAGAVVWSAVTDASNIYAFHQPSVAAINPHPVGISALRPVTIDGFIVEVGDHVTSSDGDMFTFGAPSSSTSYVIRNSITLPQGGDITKHAGQFVSCLGGANCSISLLHNTWVCSVAGGESGAPSYGETFAGVANMFAAVKSNLAYGLNAGTGQIFTRRASSVGTVSDAVAAANADYNGVYQPITSNAASGAYQGVPGYYDWLPQPPTNPMFSTTAGLGAHDVQGDPGLVDPSRNLATWAVSRGSVSGTYDGKCTDALSYLAADPSLIDDLFTHVRGGFAPTAPIYRDAGHDGVTIGAVAYAGPTGVLPQIIYYLMRRRRAMVVPRPVPPVPTKGLPTMIARRAA